MSKPFILTAEQRKHLKGKVLHHLLTYCRGRQNAIRGKALAWQWGYGDDRLVRLIIRELIAEGYPIASAVSEPMGYFLAINEHEAAGYIRVLNERIKEDQSRLYDFLLASHEFTLPEQMTLVEGGKNGRI